VRSELSGEIVVEDVERSADDGSGGTQVRMLRRVCWLDRQQDVKMKTGAREMPRFVWHMPHCWHSKRSHAGLGYSQRNEVSCP